MHYIQRDSLKLNNMEKNTQILHIYADRIYYMYYTYTHTYMRSFVKKNQITSIGK